METLLFFVLLIVFIGEVVAIAVKFPMLIIALGNIGDCWVRIPQNTDLAILKHKTLINILHARNSNSGLKWIGPSFLGYEVYEWFETEEDEKDGVNALHSIDLAEQVIKYLPAEPQKIKEGDKIIAITDSKIDSTYGVPSFKSADNIEIRTSLSIFFIVRDSEKALFNLRYRKKAIREQIFPLWRDVIGEFSFFDYGDESLQTNPNIRTESNDALRKKIGIDTEERDPKCLAQKLFLNEWGMWIRDVTVGELEASDPAIEQALGAQMIARTKALAEIESAKGRKTAFELDGAGKEFYISSIVKAFSVDGKKTSEAIQATNKWRQLEAMENMPGEGKYVIQWPEATSGLENILKKFDLTILQNILEKIAK